MTWITANFPNLSESSSSKVVAGTTTRLGGVSQTPYTGLNLATHVDDDIKDVLTNRAILREQQALPNEPYWLNQTHSSTVIELPYQYRSYQDGENRAIIEADASFTKLKEHVCAVMTADCLPLLIVDDKAEKVAAIHAGWRGLADGIISTTITAMKTHPESLHVWLGPAIGPKAFEVGAEVREAFVKTNQENENAFVQTQENKYLCDIYKLATNELKALGISFISGGEHCTVTEADLFYSYRRDGQTGRMASLIWINN